MVHRAGTASSSRTHSPSLDWTVEGVVVVAVAVVAAVVGGLR